MIRSSSRFTLITLGLFSLSTLGCQGLGGGNDPLRQGSTVIEPTGEGEKEEARWGRIFEQLRLADKRGDLEGMEQWLKAASGDDNPSWVKEKVAFYSSLLRARILVKEEGFKAFFTLAKPDFTVGETVRVRLRVENRMDGSLSFPLSGEECIVRTNMKVLDYDVFGDISEKDHTLNLRIKRPLTVESGGAQEVGFRPFKLDFLPGVAMRVVTLSGNLRFLGSHIMASMEKLPLKEIPLGSLQFRAFGKNFQDIKRSPLHYLGRALEKMDPKYLRVIYLAGVFLPESDVKEATRLLMEALERVKERRLCRVIMVTLKKITGVKLPTHRPEKDAQHWLRWWEKKRS